MPTPTSSVLSCLFAMSVCAALGVAPALHAGDPPSAASWLELGRSLQRAKDTQGAIDAYRQALQLDPQLAAAHWELGWSYYVLSDYQQTLACWDQARALDPGLPGLDLHYPPVAELARLMAGAAPMTGWRSLPADEGPPAAGEALTIAATGDIMLGSDYPPGGGRLPPDGGSALFSGVGPYLRDADVTIGNLEGVFASGLTSSKCAGMNNCFVFRMPPRLAPVLAAAGFDVMNNANNHSHDFGPAGVRQTLDTLRGAGILPTGTLGSTASLNVRGISIAVIGAAPNVGCYPLNDETVLAELTRQMAASHSVVIANIHGGAEGIRAVHVPDRMETFCGEHRGHLRRTARLLIDAGADLVLGHGPHVLRGMELYNGRLIAYSLGNFCVYGGFSLSGPQALSAVLRVELAADGALRAARIIPVLLTPPGVPALDPDGQAIGLIRKLSQEDFGPAAVPFDEHGVYAGSSGHSPAGSSGSPAPVPSATGYVQ